MARLSERRFVTLSAVYSEFPSRVDQPIGLRRKNVAIQGGEPSLVVAEAAKHSICRGVGMLIEPPSKVREVGTDR